MQLNTMFHDWLSRRKITDTVLEDFGIAEDSHFVLGPCIKIPIHDFDGTFIFNKYRRNPQVDEKPKYVYDKGGRISLYGVHKIKPEHTTILITEGEMDCLVAWSSHIPAVSSTGGALSFQEEWVPFFEGKEVIVCFDNDAAGGEGIVRVLSYLPHAKVMFIPDRPGVKDISDYVTNGGDLHTLMLTARAFDSIEAVKEDQAERNAVWQSTFFHEAFITEYFRRQVPKNTKHTYTKTDKLARAKEYPIKNLITFNQGKALCLWHSEKSPSMTYFPDTNKCYCFGCGKMADAIDVYRTLNHCSFTKAVDYLSNVI